MQLLFWFLKLLIRPRGKSGWRPLVLGSGSPGWSAGCLLRQAGGAHSPSIGTPRSST